MNEKIRDIKLGQHHSIVLNEDGDIIVFGSNMEGQGLSFNKNILYLFFILFFVFILIYFFTFYLLFIIFFFFKKVLVFFFF